MKRFPLPWLLAFLLGGGLTFTAVRLTPLLVSSPEDPEELTLVIPALAEATYAYRQTLGFSAVLETSDGRRLELPSAWLPGEAAAGERFLVTTEARPGAGETTFSVTFRPVTTSARALPRSRGERPDQRGTGGDRARRGGRRPGLIIHPHPTPAESLMEADKSVLKEAIRIANRRAEGRR